MFLYLYCMCFCIYPQLAVTRDTSIVHLNKRCFSYCRFHLEFGVLQQLMLQTSCYKGWECYIRRSRANSSWVRTFTSQYKEQCLLLCIVLNLGLSKLISTAPEVCQHSHCLHYVRLQSSIVCCWWTVNWTALPDHHNYEQVTTVSS